MSPSSRRRQRLLYSNFLVKLDKLSIYDSWLTISPSRSYAAGSSARQSSTWEENKSDKLTTMTQNTQNPKQKIHFSHRVSHSWRTIWGLKHWQQLIISIISFRKLILIVHRYQMWIKRRRRWRRRADKNLLLNTFFESDSFHATERNLI